VSIYDKLIADAASYGLTVVEKHFKSNARGLIKGSKIGIRKDMLTVEKACALAEEIGHNRTSIGDLLDQSDVRKRKQESRARQYAYECMIPLGRIVQAYKMRIFGRYELAEFLGVSEEFLQSAIDRYTEKFGIYVKYNERYTIKLCPLEVIDKYRYKYINR